MISRRARKRRDNIKYISSLRDLRVSARTLPGVSASRQVFPIINYNAYFKKYVIYCPNYDIICTMVIPGLYETFFTGFYGIGQVFGQSFFWPILGATKTDPDIYHHTLRKIRLYNQNCPLHQ